MKKLCGIRGAVFCENTEISIRRAVEELFSKIKTSNPFEVEDVVSVQFTVTKDITAFNPATALRESKILGNVPLFCALEPDFVASKPSVIRTLVTVHLANCPQHIYCNGAEILRPDLGV
ncbi:MAG: chorismate mutase [Spirochaetaceae bacterium]|nr:chorismate mutase [Spirochaetaceae bacterium]